MILYTQLFQVILKELLMNNIAITGNTKLTALLGSPVKHSISPLMHNEAFKQLGLDYVYLCFDVNEKSLANAVSGLKSIGIRGFNLTMPNKNKIIELIDALSPAATLIRAVNTVINDNGILTGHNTDGTGFIQSLKDINFSIAQKKVVILGNGGAAMAIAAQAALDGASEINIFSRPQSSFAKRTRQLCDDITKTTNATAYNYDTKDTSQLQASLKNSELLINATSVGMAPNTDASIIEDVSLFHESLLVADIIYEPRMTKFLQIAKSRGCQTCNGMYMLLHQGAKAFKLFTGEEMPVELIRSRYFL